MFKIETSECKHGIITIKMLTSPQELIKIWGILISKDSENNQTHTIKEISCMGNWKKHADNKTLIHWYKNIHGRQFNGRHVVHPSAPPTEKKEKKKSKMKGLNLLPIAFRSTEQKKP